MMQQLSERSRIFLGEMGVGAQWTLRAVPGAAAAADPTVAQQPVATPEPAVVVAEAATLAPSSAVAAQLHAVAAVAPLAQAVSPVAPLADHVAAVASVAPPAVAPPVAEPVAAAIAAPAPDDDNAWFDHAPAPRRASPISAEAIAAMDWPALAGAIAVCTRCELCGTRRDAGPGRGPVGPARWLALAAAPGRQDEKDRRAVSGDAGLLLDNMLKAAGLAAPTDVHVTHLVKCRPAGPDGADRAPTQDEVTACRPFLERELALTQAAVIVTFGQAAARGLLGAGAARGKVHRHGARPVVATYHPDDLLRRPEDKARSWADLCLARTAL
jgi:uracil-DNA glycosylase family 4